MKTRMYTRLMRSAVCVSFGIPAVLAGCGGDSSTIETRTVSAPGSSGDSPLSTADRMGLGAPPGTPPAGGGFSYDVPPGWQSAPSTSMRPVNLKAGPNGEAECYVTVLSGGGGGLEANVNRWRAQMAQAPYSAQEIAELPRITLLGREAVFMEFAGSYSGMTDTVQEAEARLLGVILDDPAQAVFVKFTGPDAIVAAEKDRFLAFCDSLSMTGGGSPAGDPHAGLDLSSDPHAGLDLSRDPHAGLDMSGITLGDPHGHTTPTAFTWIAPEGWTRSADRPMRLVTYTMGESGLSECYVTLLPGSAGGVAANINRWQEQMGQPPLSPSALEALPTLDVVNRASKMVEITGDFTDMGGQTVRNAMMLGLVCELPAQTVFVKMTGPVDEIQAHRDAFIAFCESIEEGAGAGI